MFQLTSHRKAFLHSNIVGRGQKSWRRFALVAFTLPLEHFDYPCSANNYQLDQEGPSIQQHHPGVDVKRTFRSLTPVEISLRRVVFTVPAGQIEDLNV